MRELSRAGAAGLHLEDQVAAKRCGHRPGKELVDVGGNGRPRQGGRRRATRRRVRRDGPHRCAAVRGPAGGDRSRAAYVAAGADMIFAEALTTLDEYRQFTAAVKVPVLANITEFGKTPLFTTEELARRACGWRSIRSRPSAR